MPSATANAIDMRVEIGLELDWERADERHGAQRLGAPDRDQHADGRPEQRQHQVLGQQRRGDAPWPGAERETDADLAVTCGSRASIRFAVLPQTASSNSSMIVCRMPSACASIRCGRAAPARTGAPRPASSGWSRDRPARDRASPDRARSAPARASPTDRAGPSPSSRASIDRRAHAIRPSVPAPASPARTDRSSSRAPCPEISFRRDADDRQHAIVDADRPVEDVRVGGEMRSASSRAR